MRLTYPLGDNNCGEVLAESLVKEIGALLGKLRAVFEKPLSRETLWEYEWLLGHVAFFTSLLDGIQARGRGRLAMAIRLGNDIVNLIESKENPFREFFGSGFDSNDPIERMKLYCDLSIGLPSTLRI